MIVESKFSCEKERLLSLKDSTCMCVLVHSNIKSKIVFFFFSCFNVNVYDCVFGFCLTSTIFSMAHFAMIYQIMWRTFIFLFVNCFTDIIVSSISLSDFGFCDYASISIPR